jgi:drug/metabolite transporter superfamily protein YnfA
MMKLILLFLFSTLMAFAGEKAAIPAYAALSGMLIIIGLFFWGIYKAVKTQKTIYAVALLPFVLLLFVMFFI